MMMSELDTRSRPIGFPGHDHRPTRDALEDAGRELTALIQRSRQENPCVRMPTRIRRSGPVTTQLIDRLPAPEDSLAVHLDRQIGLMHLSERRHTLVSWLIWNLDSDGYFRQELPSLATVAGVAVGDLEQALDVVQALEPTGVGARSLRECLKLQLRAQPEPDPVALELVDRHLKALAEKRYDDLARALGQPLARILQALATIRRLEPRPGRPFGGAPAQTIWPEVVIEKAGDDYRVVLRDDEEIPEVSVNRCGWAAAAAASGEARAELVRHLRAASWMISAVERRRHTVRGVVESIVRRQRDFLEHGTSRLRPLSFREVAAEVGVHESTVSRAVAHRYAATPQGVFPLRAFFTQRLPGDPDGAASPAAVRERISAIVAAEHPARPLPDHEIVVALADAGIRVARRTVVKYRELLGIAAAHVRRSLAA